MILLDMRTAVFGVVLTYIVCALVIVLLWRQSRKRFAGTDLWMFCFGMQTVALLLIILRGHIPDWASVVLANILLIYGVFVGYLGLERFVGERSSQIHNYVLLAVFAVVHVWFTFVQPDLEVRKLNISIGLLIIYFQCMWLMLYRVPAFMRPLTREVGIICGVFCLPLIARIANIFISARKGDDFFRPGIVDPLIMIFGQVLLVLLTYSIVLMVNRRLLADIAIQEEKFSKAFYSSPYAITLSRFSDGFIVEANEGFVNFTGYSLGEAVGKTELDLRLWEKNEDRAWMISELEDKGKVHERELRFRRKSGEVATVLFSAEVITINNEKYVLSSIKDITLSKKAEEDLREAHDYLENLLSYASSPIIVWDSQLRITRFNKAFEQLSGRSAQEVLGQTVDIIFPHGSQKQSVDYLKKANAGERWNGAEIDIRHVDGSVRTLLWNSSAVYLPDGKTITATIAQGQDITEHKRTREEIIRLNAQLEQKVAERTRELNNAQTALLNLVDDLNQSANNLASANRNMEAVNKELAAFSYSASHDLRAPLRSIEGFSNALLEDCYDKLDDEGKNYLERIRRAVQNMSQLIEDMLKLSRLTQSDLIREKVDLSKIVQEIAESQEQEEPVKKTGLIIQEGVVVEADRRLMHIVLTNLLDNAWKFTSKEKNPQVEFGTTIRDGKTVIFLRDNGVGFDMDYVDKLFGAFQRLHKADEFPGTGIGLATVRRIINRHGGQIWAEGEQGKGATFFFTLPEGSVKRHALTVACKE